MKDALVADSRHRSLIAYTHDDLSAAEKCAAAGAPSHAVQNCRGPAQRRSQFRGQEMAAKMKDTPVADSRCRPLSSFLHEGVSAAWTCATVITPSRAAGNHNGCVYSTCRCRGQRLRTKVQCTCMAQSQAKPFISYERGGAIAA